MAEVDLGYDLSGVEATWTPEAGGEGWSGWLPHPDLAVARAFTAGSAEHDRLWEAMARPGRLTLRTRVDLWQMLRPAVQPGSTIGYRLPDEEVTLTLAASGPIAVKSPGASGSSGASEDGRHTRPHHRDAEGAAADPPGDHPGDRRRPRTLESRGRRGRTRAAGPAPSAHAPALGDPGEAEGATSRGARSPS